MATSKGSAKKSGAKKAGGAKRAAPTSGAVPPYGEAIRGATARGDLAEMRRVAASARKWIKDAQTALDKLEQKLTKAGGR